MKILGLKISKVRFKKNPNVNKKNYSQIEKQEFKYDKKTDLVPNKKNRLLCIMFSDDKGAYFIIRPYNSKKQLDYFVFKKGMYIIDNESIHITGNGTRISFYMEGVSTPIKMSNIEKEIIEIPYIDLYGNRKVSTIQKIKGLNFDAKILNTFANRRFAELFTKTPIKGLEFILLILSIATIIMVGISYAVTYFMR